MSGAFRIEPLGGQDRSRFQSGSEALDRYFRETVGQDIRRRVAGCFVAIDGDGEVAGFYTLAATSLLLDALPTDRQKKLPRYPLVPAVLLGRLAVATGRQGQRLGSALLADALIRAAASEAVAHLMVVDAKDDEAIRFYEHFGFIRLDGAPNRLVRPL
jgi:ribosomal protein S18 acetylase RimI-like enzyme